jgi:hypothetical protein
VYHAFVVGTAMASTVLGPVHLDEHGATVSEEQKVGCPDIPRADPDAGQGRNGERPIFLGQGLQTN